MGYVLKSQVIKYHKLQLRHKNFATTFGYTLNKEMNLPVKAAIATLLLTPTGFINKPFGVSTFSLMRMALIIPIKAIYCDCHY
ncbi:hypothetical protein CXF79_13590 [Colwellia sp. Bg11-28]|nr:hypothetical protein CXF79_13590 [Colwellia sp. Bg11-28]